MKRTSLRLSSTSCLVSPEDLDQTTCFARISNIASESETPQKWVSMQVQVIAPGVILFVDQKNMENVWKCDRWSYWSTAYIWIHDGHLGVWATGRKLWLWQALESALNMPSAFVVALPQGTFTKYPPFTNRSYLLGHIRHIFQMLIHWGSCELEHH